jgi:hypothetical protein
MAHACTSAAIRANKAMTPHPCSRLCFPPRIKITNAAIVIPSITTAKDIKNPTDRHILQKYLSSPPQSSGVGKDEQCSFVAERESVFEHRLCRPYVECIVVPWFVSSSKEIHSGMMMDARVRPVPTRNTSRAAEKTMLRVSMPV